jgi:glycosyltransferase involved in cell wall biosynthesis
MRRVIYAWNYLEWGGAQIHILALIKEVRKEFDVIVLIPEGYDPQFHAFLDSQNVPYETFPGHLDLAPRFGITGKLRRHWLKIKSEYHMLRRMDKIGLADSIAHVDLLPNQSLLALVWLCLRTEVFITSHNAMPTVAGWRWLLWRIKFRAISIFDTFHVFCSNENAKRYFRQLYSQRVADEIKVTYTSVNPVEIDEAREAPFDRDSQLVSIGVPPDRFLILALGQFIDRKGRWTFLDAAAKVSRQIDDVVFVWVTPKLPTDADLDRIERYGLNGAFRLIESSRIGRDRQDVLRFLRVADVFALPSFVEGLPIALLEAMAIGIPSISTNVNGIPEAIINEETGLLIDAGDAEALSRAILRLKIDSALRRKLGARGRAIVMEKFDERDAARSALAAYKAAAEGHR